MRVTISVGGRFHAFYLAQQLLKRGCLERLITSYPKFEVKKYDIPPEKIKSVVLKEILGRGWAKMPGFIRGLYDPSFFISDVFDKLASNFIIPSDLFVGWSNKSLYSMRKAKAAGAITIIERGSSHIVYQNDILKEEYRRWGIKAPFDPVHPKIIEKEMREYAESDFISIPSLFVKRTFLEKGVPEWKLIHAPYGTELAQFKKIPKLDSVFRVVYVGSMNLRKGVPYLLQAFSELKLSNAELLLIGSITDEIKPFFKKYEGSYKWIGHVPQSELYKHYSQGSVFAIMSVEEGLALVQPQAMACGLPVITTTNTGAEDIVRDGKDGFIIPIRDVDALKEKLTYFYENKSARDAMSVSAMDRVRSGFTWDAYGDRVFSNYERILAKSPG